MSSEPRRLPVKQIRRVPGMRSDYELALLPIEMMAPEERAYVSVLPDHYWIQAIERGERDLATLQSRITELEAENKRLHWINGLLRDGRKL